MSNNNAIIKNIANNAASKSIARNNASIKSIVNTIKKNNNSRVSNSKNNNLVNNIDIKHKTTNNLKYWIAIVFPVLIFLFYLLYQYNLGSRSNYIISNMGYKKKIKNTPLMQCYQQEKKYQFKLCDYYISASYMTPCVGNQHYDYVSTDMIIEVIQSGARYIQIPICEADVNQLALPVVGTAIYGTRVITSLNTLDIQSVLKVIRANAFKLNNKSINYPLIIHFILNTINSYTLGIVADNVQEILSDVLVDVPKYTKYPFFLEKICNLLGKIIIISTPEYKDTKLEPYIVPTFNLFKKYHYSEITNITLQPSIIYSSLYNKKLSGRDQTQSSIAFKAKYPSIKYIVNNANTIGDTILKDKDVLNNLILYNKIGITMNIPNSNVDVISKNYDISEAVYVGCQLNTMNFQINDNNMKNYLEMFKDSSFRLKPSSMRFTDQEEPEIDLFAKYQNIMKIDENILNNLFYKYGNQLISIESYTLPNNYITQIENNLKFNLGSNQIRDNFANITYKIGVNQCFIPRKSTIGGSDNISMYLESASVPGLYITLNGGIFNLEYLAEKKKGLIKQAFYFEKPKTLDTEQINKGEIISIRNFDDKNILYLAYENRNVKAYSNLPQTEAHNNMTFFIKPIKYQTVVKIITIYDGSLKTIGGNIIGVVESNTTDGTPYIITPVKELNFNIFKDQFSLLNKNTKTYVGYDSTNNFLYDKYLTSDSNTVFSIIPKNGYYTIVNVNAQSLILFDNNLIKFTNKTIMSNEDLFKLDITYDLLN